MRTKEELKKYLVLDKESMGLHSKTRWKEFLKGNLDEWIIFNQIKTLRYLEYYKENRNGFINKCIYVIIKHYYKYKSRKNNIHISPGVFKEGLHIVHLGYIWVDRSSLIGKNCTILPRVLLGKKKPGIKAPNIFIGDNCYIGTGVTILGPVKIGNNVTIGAGSVVVRDIPDNAVVAGNPARILRVIK